MVQTPKKEEILRFEKEISFLSKDIQEILNKKKKIILEFVKEVKLKVKNLSIGFYLCPKVYVEDSQTKFDFNELTIHFLLDDFERPVPDFEPKILLDDTFEKVLKLVEEHKKTGEVIKKYVLREDEKIFFEGSSISILRERCFDSDYYDLKNLLQSLIIEDQRDFLGALKSIEMHKNMLLEKFAKYIVVYAGAGSWLRGEKSNDFDIFIVIDDTDVKKMSRLQVKEQLTQIIWNLSHQVAKVTGIQIHIQIYLLTDFWDYLKDATPTIFTFLRDGVPFYDRGLYSSWKELLRLGKIKPSLEAIELHLRSGNDILNGINKIFQDVIVSLFWGVVNPSQSLLMMRGFSPTTPKETIKIFEEILLKKEKLISQKELDTLKLAVQSFKDLEHKKDLVITGKFIDDLIMRSKEFMEKIKKIFEKISSEKATDEMLALNNELVLQIKKISNIENEKKSFDKFEKEYIEKNLFSNTVKKAFKSIEKAKNETKKNKLTNVETNKVIKEIRTVLGEIKNYSNNKNKEKNKKLILKYGPNLHCEFFSNEGKIYLLNPSKGEIFKFEKKEFVKENSSNFEKLNLLNNFEEIQITADLVDEAKKVLKVKDLFF